MTGFTRAAVAGGHMNTCRCGWEIWNPSEAHVDNAAHEHAKKCKHHTQEAKK